MKKFKKSIALLAAAALVTGGLFLSCSNSSDDDDESTEEVLNSSGNEADNSGNANSDAENSGNTGDTTTNTNVSFEWTALDYAPETISDKTAASGALGDYISISGTGATWRAKSDGTAYTSLELGKASNGCLQGLRIIYFYRLFQGILRVYHKAFVFLKLTDSLPL